MEPTNPQPPVPAPAPVALVCPACRVPGPDGGLVVARLAAGDDACLCPGCGAAYPVVDGIACVPGDLDAMRGYLDGSAPESLVEAFLPAAFAVSQWPEVVEGAPWLPDLSENVALVDRLAGWVARHARPVPGADDRALEVGCGTGRLLVRLSGLFPGGAVGMDLRLTLLRLARRLLDGHVADVRLRLEGSRLVPVRVSPVERPAGPVALVLGDAMAPPFLAESFPVVAAMSLLDTVPDPLFVLGQLDALVAPGGLLLIATPYSWEPGITPPERWWSTPETTGAAFLVDALEGRRPELPHLRYERLEEDDNLPWGLPGHGRLVHRFGLHAVLARKS
jgi:SAM-dependent methyltransferase